MQTAITKIALVGWLTNKNIHLTKFWSRKVHHQGTSRSRVWWGVVGSCLLLVPHMAIGAGELSGVFLIRALIPFTRLHPHDLMTPSKTLPLSTITLVIRFQYLIWGEDTNIRIIASTVFYCLPKYYSYCYYRRFYITIENQDQQVVRILMSTLPPRGHCPSFPKALVSLGSLLLSSDRSYLRVTNQVSNTRICSIPKPPRDPSFPNTNAYSSPRVVRPGTDVSVPKLHLDFLLVNIAANIPIWPLR